MIDMVVSGEKLDNEKKKRAQASDVIRIIGFIYNFLQHKTADKSFYCFRLLHFLTATRRRNRMPVVSINIYRAHANT